MQCLLLREFPAGADLNANSDEYGERIPTRLRLSDALGEVFCVCVVGILPLIFVGLGSIQVTEPASALAAALLNPVSKGQLFLYSFSLFGSLIWIFITQAKVYTRMWLGIYTTALVAPGAAAIFFYGRNPNMDSKMNPYISILSIVFYLLYVLIYIRLLTHIPTQVASFGETTSKDAKDTADRSKQYIG